MAELKGDELVATVRAALDLRAIESGDAKATLDAVLAKLVDQLAASVGVETTEDRAKTRAKQEAETLRRQAEQAAADEAAKVKDPEPAHPGPPARR